MMIRELALISLAMLGASAQTTPEQLYRNVGRLNVSVALDRELYLPLEIPTVTIRVSNPTTVSLVVPRPFLRETGTLVMFEGVDVGKFWAANEHWVQPEITSNTPTITITPGEVKEIIF